jgi:hypothetical protein
MRGVSDGHVAVDAMVALLIVSLAIVLSLRTVRQSEQAAALAEELRRANVLMNQVMLEGPRSFTPAQGATNGFDWSLETQTIGDDRPVEVCRRVVRLTNHASSRRFWASTFVICPAVES